MDLAAKLSLPGHRRLQNARRHCGVCWTGETWKISLPWGVAGNSARRPTRFLLRQKVGQKGGPYDGGPAARGCTRRQGLKREASETRCAQTADASLSVSVPADASPSNGGPRQKPLQKQEQRQRQLSLRGQWHRNAGLQVTTDYSTMPASQAGPAWQCGHSTYGSTGLATAACIRRSASRRQQEALRHQVVGRCRHRRHVARLGAVQRLQRRPRVAGRDARRLGLVERDVGAGRG